MLFIFNINNNKIQFISEVCSGGELPEVEIISLLHENIPKYKLRADTLTSFSGKCIKLKKKP